DAAQQLLVARLRENAGGNAPTLQLVEYLAQHGAGDGALTQTLREVYEREGRPPALGQALASLLPEDEATTLLVEHVRAKPEDTQVFEQLLTRRLLPTPEARKSPERLTRSLDITAELMKAHPAQAEVYAVTLVRAANDPVALRRAVESLPQQK